MWPNIHPATFELPVQLCAQKNHCMAITYIVFVSLTATISATKQR